MDDVAKGAVSVVACLGTLFVLAAFCWWQFRQAKQFENEHGEIDPDHAKHLHQAKMHLTTQQDKLKLSSVAKLKASGRYAKDQLKLREAANAANARAQEEGASPGVQKQAFLDDVQPHVKHWPARGSESELFGSGCATSGDDGDDGGSGSAPADSPQGPDAEYYEIVLPGGEKLGVDLDVDSLQVWNIGVSGMIPTWNMEHPQSQVEEGDMIIVVNDIRNDIEAVVGEIRKNNEMKMLLQHHKFIKDIGVAHPDEGRDPEQFLHIQAAHEAPTSSGEGKSHHDNTAKASGKANGHHLNTSGASGASDETNHPQDGSGKNQKNLHAKGKAKAKSKAHSSAGKTTHATTIGRKN